MRCSQSQSDKNSDTVYYVVGIITHSTRFARCRLYLVWQRCSCTLVGGALTLLSIAMEHERTLVKNCVGGGDDDWEADDKYVPTDDDCKGRGVKDRTYVKNYLFYVMYGVRAQRVAKRQARRSTAL